MERTYEDLLRYLESELGAGLKMAVAFDQTGYEFLRGEAWYEEFLEENDTRTPGEMHKDGRSLLKKLDVAGDLYDTEVHSQLRVTEAGTGVFLVPDDQEGVFFWIGPETEFTVPNLIEGCIERVE